MYDSRTLMIKKGALGLGSVSGHYNFYYPDETKECTFRNDCIIHKKEWIPQQGYVAVKVKKGFVDGPVLSFKDYDILWVREEDIQRY